MSPTEVKLISIHRPTKITGERLLGNLGREGNVKPTPEHPLIISASELRDFLRCRVMWNWRHQVGIEPKRRSTALALGTLVHQGKDLWYQVPFAKRGVKVMTKIARKLTQVAPTEALSTEDLELVNAMLIGYAAWAKQKDPEVGLFVAQPELKFDLPLTSSGTIRVRGRIDVAFKPTTLKHTMGFLESKTAGQFKTDVIERNLQLSVYFWAMRMLNPKAKRFIGYYQQLRKQMPTSRVRAPLFVREDVERSASEIDQWVIDTQRVAQDMLDASIYPNPMDSCSWGCDYTGPCLLRGEAKDLQHVLNTEYQPKEYKK
jgi:hypothetical protein